MHSYYPICVFRVRPAGGASHLCNPSLRLIDSRQHLLFTTVSVVCYCIFNDITYFNLLALLSFSSGCEMRKVFISNTSHGKRYFLPVR